MAHHRVHPGALTARARVRAGATVVLLAAIVLTPAPARAHNEWEGSYRRWPWKAGTNVVLTTLPGDCPHCPQYQSSSSWKAIDAGMNYETVYSIAPGRVITYEPSGGGAGKYLQVRDDDGTVITYEHLSKALVTSGDIVAGQPIAVSGNTGNSTGPHLHFQRTDGTSFSSNALSLTPISNHGTSADPLRYTSYLSDNAGVSYTAGGAGLSYIRKEYNEAGGYSGFGVTADVGDAWSPCRNDGITGTWFRYVCQPRAGVSGSVQTYVTADRRQRALMHSYGAPDAYRVKRGILAAYTEKYNGQDWVYWLGFPTGNRTAQPAGGYKQTFQFGYVIYEHAACRERMYVNGSLWMTYYFCD